MGPVPNRGGGPCFISLCASISTGTKRGGGGSDSGAQVPLAQCNSLQHISKTEDCKPNLNNTQLEIIIESAGQ